MKNETMDIINKLEQVVGSSSEYVLSEYTHYFVVSSFVWLLFGLSMIVVIVKAKLPDHWDVHPLVVKGFIMFIGGIFVAANLSDLLSPNAAAIHQLLKDIRGE